MTLCNHLVARSDNCLNRLANTEKQSIYLHTKTTFFFNFIEKNVAGVLLPATPTKISLSACEIYKRQYVPSMLMMAGIFIRHADPLQC